METEVIGGLLHLVLLHEPWTMLRKLEDQPSTTLSDYVHRLSMLHNPDSKISYEIIERWKVFITKIIPRYWMLNMIKTEGILVQLK